MSRKRESGEPGLNVDKQQPLKRAQHPSPRNYCTRKGGSRTRFAVKPQKDWRGAQIAETVVPHFSECRGQWSPADLYIQPENHKHKKVSAAEPLLSASSHTSSVSAAEPLYQLSPTPPQKQEIPETRQGKQPP